MPRSQYMVAEVAFAIPLILLVVPGALCTERLNVLAIGQVMPGECLIPIWFEADPLVDYLLIPTDIDVMAGQGVAGQRVMEDAWRRYIRIYFPKTRNALMESFEFIAFPDGYIEPFTPSQQADIRYAMENGVGAFVTMGGDLSGPSYKAYPGWKNSVLCDLLPVQLTDNMRQDGAPFRIRVAKNDPQVLSMFVVFGIERLSGSGFTYLYPKAGVTIWGKMASSGLPVGAPGDWLVSWQTGSRGGLFWAVADDLDHAWWSPRTNDYGMDIFLNILLYSTGRRLPQDISMLHELRNRYWRYNEERLLLYSLLEFVDRFGGNTASIEQRITGVDDLKEASFARYREQDYEAAWNTIDRALAQILSAANDAMKLKDRALLWVYITEWLAVTGTFFACGFVVYSLLVRRKLYKEVGVTRAER